VQILVVIIILCKVLANREIVNKNDLGIFLDNFWQKYSTKISTQGLKEHKRNYIIQQHIELVDVMVANITFL